MDVVVVGAGITGALIADAIAAEGLAVLVVDRRLPTSGSTAVSTALLQYELDVELLDLAARVGRDVAEQVYRQSAGAIDALDTLTRGLPDDCGFSRRRSIYRASSRHDARRLVREGAARESAGLEAEFLDAAAVAGEYGLPSHGALVTRCAAVVDPVRLARAALARAVSRGAVVAPWTTALEAVDDGIVTVTTSAGTVRCAHLVLAPGYELPPCLEPSVAHLHSTFALITEPVAERGPLDQCIVWESARPYTYLRGAGERIVIGGMDLRHRDDVWRDRALPQRTRRLEAALSALIPGANSRTAFTWAGTFAETDDGMPVIGPIAEGSHVSYALGYGGNGITFSVLAAEMLRDVCLGRSHELVHIFRPDR